jgi:hypothetical protein
MNWDDAPDSNEFEVSLFGPGRGECCLLHIGANEWIVVDSCVNQRTGSNPALDYLAAINVNLQQVVRIVASHAHDDHIAGISDIVEACTNAEFYASLASTRDEFLTLVEIDEHLEGLVRPSAYREYRRIHSILEARAGRGYGRRVGYNYAIEGLPIYKRAGTSAIPGATVVALSPSHEAVTRSLEHFASLLPQDQSQIRRIATQDPNTFSVALSVTLGDFGVLLGADLLRGPGHRCGWNAVLTSPHRSTEPASLIKVPHHGSANAHHDSVWSEMLAPDPVAVLTPFRGGSNPPPSVSDRARICGLTQHAYITADPDAPARPHHVKKAAALLGTVAHNVREPDGYAGHVRCRRSPAAAAWAVELFDPARPLCAVGTKATARKAPRRR